MEVGNDALLVKIAVNEGRHRSSTICSFEIGKRDQRDKAANWSVSNNLLRREVMQIHEHRS
jgi:hypothetical protein